MSRHSPPSNLQNIAQAMEPLQEIVALANSPANQESGCNGDSSLASCPDRDRTQAAQSTNPSLHGSCSDSLPPLQSIIEGLVAQYPHLPEVQQLQHWQQERGWLEHFQPSNRLFVAVLEPGTFILHQANPSFAALLGLTATRGASMKSTRTEFKAAASKLELLARLPESSRTTLQTLYRQHLLQRILWQRYQIDLQRLGLLGDPILVCLNSPLYTEPRWLQLWLGSEQLQIVCIDPSKDEFADLELLQLPPEKRESRLMQSDTLQMLEQQLQIENYQITGPLLLEGLDVTVQETLRSIVQLAIEPGSILQPHKFGLMNQRLRSLFRAQNCLILSAENGQAKLLLGKDYNALHTATYSLQSLQSSHFLQAAEANQVRNVPDLSQDSHSLCEQHLVQKRGVRSLLLIPVSAQLPNSRVEARQLVGLIGLTSNCPHHFNRADCDRAQALIPALTTALHQAIQQRVTHIHPAVEWRFLQEAERRSWGLPAEPIVFEAVYPLYGISDIRGSSNARNNAIQTDLLAQFHLGLAVVDAVCEQTGMALAEQLRLDLLERIDQLQAKVTVDAEVTATHYLQSALEMHFEYFSQCSTAALSAVEAYQRGCADDRACVYEARDRYDQTIGQINSQLRATWEKWQRRMQHIVPHYCDVEATDGIDHMIYAGASIEPKFCLFHLRSLRYEQLRAVCDCARTAFQIQAQSNTTLQVTHLVLVQDVTVDIFHDETTERLFDVRGTRDTRYEIVKKRIDKALDANSRDRITQPGMLTVVYSTDEEWNEYQQYLHYLAREGWVGTQIESGPVEPMQGVSGLKFARVEVLPEPDH